MPAAFLIDYCVRKINCASLEPSEPAPLGPLRQAVVFGPRLTVLVLSCMANASNALGRKRHDALARRFRCNAAGGFEKCFTLDRSFRGLRKYHFVNDEKARRASLCDLV